MTKSDFYDLQKTEITAKYKNLRVDEKMNRTDALLKLSTEYKYSPKTLYTIMKDASYRKSSQKPTQIISKSVPINLT